MEPHEKDPKGKEIKMKVIVIEEPTNKKMAALDYMEFHTGRTRSSSSCERSFMVGCCVIHPL